MHDFKRICVYCGSSSGGPSYVAAAKALGALMAQQGIGLVYGGGHVGLMGVIADAVLEGGGEVIGVIPEKLKELELAHEGCTELIVTRGMHERKLKMAELADAFIAMPGGFGTLEELFEVTTWAQLNYHLKPVGVLNVDGYWDPLLRLVAHAVDEGFIREDHRSLILSESEPEVLLAQLRQTEIPDLHKWIDEV